MATLKYKKSHQIRTAYLTYFLHVQTSPDEYAASAVRHRLRELQTERPVARTDDRPGHPYKLTGAATSGLRTAQRRQICCSVKRIGCVVIRNRLPNRLRCCCGAADRPLHPTRNVRHNVKQHVEQIGMSRHQGRGQPRGGPAVFRGRGPVP